MSESSNWRRCTARFECRWTAITGEPGIPGVQVNLYKGDGTQIGTTYTDVNGYYLLTSCIQVAIILSLLILQDMTKLSLTKEVIIRIRMVSGNGPEPAATTYLLSGERFDMECRLLQVRTDRRSCLV
ncbi:MAG: hypothetical protein IPP49_12075 [Saprospiraceae bacterium]|nr:hypothetical protein [Saprospiraceae bacterium]